MNILDAPRDMEYLEVAADYSEVERLSRIVFPSAATERNMAYYSAYFDESTSSSSSPVLVVAGFLSTDAQWALFEKEWKEVLAEFKITAFHAQHFSKHKEGFLGWDESKRQRLMGALLSIIGQRAKLGFASVVHVKDFKKIFQGKDRAEIGSPYKIVSSACILSIGEWAKSNYQIEPVAFFFDAGNKNAGDVATTFLAEKQNDKNVPYRFGALTFEHDDILVPLQAADLAAYELWKWLDEHYAKRVRHGRYPLQELIRIQWNIREFDREVLQELADHRKGLPLSKRTVVNRIQALRPGQVD